MTKSTAERQRDFRERQRLSNEACRRLEVMVPSATHTALRCLAQHRGQTMAECVRQLVEDADRAATQGMSDAEFDRYAAAALRPSRGRSVTG
jgi:macrodomain Ter protein organizer (MatP/YcbG family)